MQFLPGGLPRSGSWAGRFVVREAAHGNVSKGERAGFARPAVQPSRGEAGRGAWPPPA